jgi:hypothetical protein
MDSLVAVDLHPLNVQVLKGDELIMIDEFARLLMGEVATPMGRTLIGMAKGMNDLASLFAAFGKAFLLALQAGNVFGISLHPALTVNLAAITHGGKGGQSQVNSDNVWCWFEKSWFCLTRETGIPIAGAITLNGQSLAFALAWSVQLDFDIPNLAQAQFAIAKQIKPTLGKREAIIAAIAAKTRIARFLTVLDAAKEGFECQIYARTNLLQGLGVDAKQRGIFGLPLRNQIDCVIAIDRHLLLPPSLFADCKGLIVEPAASLKRLLKAYTLAMIRIQAVLIGQSHRCIAAKFMRLSNQHKQKMALRSCGLYPYVSSQGYYAAFR